MSDKYVSCLNPKLCGVQNHLVGTQAACQIKGVKTQTDLDAFKLLSQLSLQSQSVPNPSVEPRKTPDRAAPKFFSSSKPNNSQFDFDRARAESEAESKRLDLYTGLSESNDINGNYHLISDNNIMGREYYVSEGVERGLKMLYDSVERIGYRDRSNNVIIENHENMSLPQKALTSILIRQMDGSILGGESRIKPGENDHEVRFTYEENNLKISGRIPVYSEIGLKYTTENTKEPFSSNQRLSGINDYMTSNGAHHAKVIESLSNKAHLVDTVRDMDIFSRQTAVQTHRKNRRAGISLSNIILDSETQREIGKRVNSDKFQILLESSDDGSEIIAREGSKIASDEVREQTISATLSALGRDNSDEERDRLCDQLYIIHEVSQDVSVRGSL